MQSRLPRRRSLDFAGRARARPLGSNRTGQGKLERAYVRLKQLYEIGKLLTRFDGVDATIPALVSIVHEALVLRSAIVILDGDRAHRTIIWHERGMDPRWLQSATLRARASYGYLAGPAGPASEQRDEANTLASSPPGASTVPTLDAERRPPMLLPLVVGGRPIFGAIQLESANGFDEADLVFVNAVVNQLAVALDRHLALERRQTSAKAPIQEAPDGPASEPLRPDERDLGERYAALVDNIDHAFVWEAEGDTFQITYVSARAELLLGYPRQRWLEDGDFWAGCVHPTDRESLAQAFRSALSGKRDQQIDHRCVDAEGRLVWLHTGIHAVRDGTRRLQGISIDVTRAKDAEERLREQLDLTRAVAHSIGDGVLAVDLQGRLTLCNPAAAGMLGWTEGEMLGRPVKDVLQIHAADGSALADDEWPFDTAMLRGKASSRDDCAFVDGHDTSFGVSLTSGPLWREGLVSGAVLAFRSTSEHDRSHSALRAAVERAQRDTHDREDLLALVSHDLKNPLSIILMTASSLARTFEAADQGRQRGQLDSIKRSAERMNRLVKDLLDTASLEAGSLSVEPCSCAVAPLLEEALRSMRPLAAHKSIRLEQDIASDLPPVRADSGRIEQVFSNLLGNAIKFTPKDGVITLRVRVRDGVVLFAVSDTGPGMSESELPHLFDRYWQARRTAKLGTGLGLSIVKGIVVAHGGQVWVESQVGAGSTFFFTLPIA